MAQQLNPKVLIQALVLLLIFFFLVFFYQVIDFKGITEGKGMEQADVARQLARGEGFTTNVLRPRALAEANLREGSEGNGGEFLPMAEVIHAPLLPFLNSLSFRFADLDTPLPEGKTVFPLDHIVAAGSLAFFILAIGVSYLLVARLFDFRLALVTAVLMMLCQAMWLFTRSGLGQMHMLFFFNLGLLFLHRAYCACMAAEAGEGGGRRPPFLDALIAGMAFALLAMTHWLALWPLFGVLLVVALGFPRRVPILVGLIVPVVLAIGIWGVRNVGVCGDPFGMAKTIFYGSLSGGEAAILRDFSSEAQFTLKGVPTRLALTSILQLDNLYISLGSVVAAPLFFLSLLHQFRNPVTARFRWLVFASWVSAGLGMALFGVGEEVVDFNQLHILFMPIMSAYGLAFLSVLWGRLNIKGHIPFAQTGHLALALTISAVPLMLSLPSAIKQGLNLKAVANDRAHLRLANWPPYYPPVLSRIGERVEEGAAVVTDIPGGLAWYGDMPALWLPTDLGQLSRIMRVFDKKGHSVAGLLLTPESIYRRLGSEIINGPERPWAGIILRLPIMGFGGPEADVLRRGSFPFKQYHSVSPRGEMVFYARKQLW